MVIWTAPQPGISDTPAFMLSGVFVSLADGLPAVLSQTAFEWQGDAWEAAVEVSSLGGQRQYAYGTIRLKPAVAAAWQRGRINPRREAVDQLRSALSWDSNQRHFGVLTFRAV
jgi:hypothetical protein